jgi:glycine/D-amino acid oxidase-like deaminating enzyme
MTAGGAGGVLWLEEALATEDAPFAGQLEADITADVCIVGGGFSGLWTAIELHRSAPELRVVLVEASGCGFGPSGRNGGWLSGWHDKVPGLLRQFGPDHVPWLLDASMRAVDDVVDATEEFEVDCDVRRGGALYATTGASQQELLRAELDLDRVHASEDDRPTPLSGEEVRARTGACELGPGILRPQVSLVHPGLLVRGLRRTARRLGIEIFERTPATGLHRGADPAVRTRKGTVSAGAVVLATGAWLAAVPELRRAILPISTQMIATAPAVAMRGRLPWDRSLALADLGTLVHYAQITRDGRIAFGRGGGAIGVHGRVRARHFHDPRWSSIVERGFRRWFPQLHDVDITHRWGGPVDFAPDHLPFAGRLPDAPAVHYAGGYSGDGVAQSKLLAKVLRSQVLGLDDEYTRSPLAGGPRRLLPPEPARSLPAWLVQSGLLWSEEREATGTPTARIHHALERLSDVTVPEALEPATGQREARRSSSPRTAR